MSPSPAGGRTDYADFQDQSGTYWRKWRPGTCKPTHERSETKEGFDPPWGSGTVLVRVDWPGCPVAIFAESVEAYHDTMARLIRGWIDIRLGIWDGKA